MQKTPNFVKIFQKAPNFINLGALICNSYPPIDIPKTVKMNPQTEYVYQPYVRIPPVTQLQISLIYDYRISFLITKSNFRLQNQFYDCKIKFLIAELVLWLQNQISDCRISFMIAKSVSWLQNWRFYKITELQNWRSIFCPLKWLNFGYKQLDPPFGGFNFTKTRFYLWKKSTPHTFSTPHQIINEHSLTLLKQTLNLIRLPYQMGICKYLIKIKYPHQIGHLIKFDKFVLRV